jgi:hypothetical protein
VVVSYKDASILTSVARPRKAALKIMYRRTSRFQSETQHFASTLAPKSTRHAIEFPPSKEDFGGLWISLSYFALQPTEKLVLVTT